VGYRGDVDFFNRERNISLDEEEEEAIVLNVAVEEELQPPNPTEEEAMEIAIGNSELGELA
jgi:hypothetical protein